MKRGFVGLITILFVSAVALLIGSIILLKSITEATMSLDQEYSNKAWATVNACGEVALYSLASTTRGDGSEWYTAYSVDGGPVSIGDYSCYILPIVGTDSSTSSPRIIKASSTVSDFTRKILIEVATNTPAIEVTSWTEVADF